jgi:hypothetical protein
MRPVIAALMVLLTAGVSPAAAQSQDTVDIHQWTQVVATLSVSQNWRVHLELQPRLNDNISQTFQVITRTAVGRQITDRLTLWTGHGWIAKPPGPGVTHEQRLWQQASIALRPLKKWAPAIRLRQEQRWQDGWADNSHRLRVMGRLVYPLTSDTRWSLATWNEAMVNFDDTTGGPARGFDQNRLFGGLLYRLARRETLEFGGMWLATRVPGGRHTDSYIPFVWLNLSY